MMRDALWDVIIEARGALTAYIESLWVGRSSATEDLERDYTERLATAAKLGTLLDSLFSIPAARMILRQEDKLFSMAFLSTDHGRDARSKFNLLSRAVMALEGHCGPDGSVSTGPETIVGERLSSVTFVQDYIQLDFDGQGFSIDCPIVIRTSIGEVHSHSDGFRDCLCATINQLVGSVRSSDRMVTIVLADSSLELIFAEGASPEPLIFTNRDHRVWVY